MARLARLAAAGHPHHLLQRGNNRQPIFLDADDYRMMLALLAEHSRAQAVAIHGYALLPDQFQLLATPLAEAHALSRLMQAVGRSYVRYFNDRHGRSGTLWEGRYRGTVLQAERHLLDTLAFIESEPVRAGLAADAAGWDWSSYLHHVGAELTRWVQPHPLFWALGNTPFAREQAWAARVAAGLNQHQIEAQQHAVRGGWALGDAAFVQALEAGSGRRMRPGKAGRPGGPAVMQKRDA